MVATVIAVAYAYNTIFWREQQDIWRKEEREREERAMSKTS